LLYRCARLGSSQSSGYEWNATLKITSWNQTLLAFESNITTGELASPVMNIEYSNGFPIYADDLTALVFLPFECITQSLQGHLNWTTQMAVGTSTVVNDWTWLTSNYTVEAGSFQSLNITLTLLYKGNPGALTLIYDVNSGIMIYEQWISISGSQIYGDIFLFSLIEVTSPTETPQTIVSLILSLAVFATPSMMFLHQVRKKLRGRHKLKRKELSNITVQRSLLGKPLCMIVAGGLLNLASILLPWSQLAGSQVYLPLSLSSRLAGSAAFFASTSTFLAINLMVYASAIFAWISIAVYLYASNRLAYRAIATVSGALAVVSTIAFVQTGWKISWGAPVLLVGGAFSLIGTVIAIKRSRAENIHAKIAPS